MPSNYNNNNNNNGYAVPHDYNNEKNIENHIAFRNSFYSKELLK